MTEAEQAAFRRGAEAMRECAECRIAESIGRIEDRIQYADSYTHEYETKKALRDVSNEMMTLQALIRALPLPEAP